MQSKPDAVSGYILVANPVPRMARLIAAWLSAFDLPVETVGTGAAALERMRQESPVLFVASDSLLDRDEVNLLWTFWTGGFVGRTASICLYATPPASFDGIIHCRHVWDINLVLPFNAIELVSFCAGLLTASGPSGIRPAMDLERARRAVDALRAATIR